jgi:hypothetical protein
MVVLFPADRLNLLGRSLLTLITNATFCFAQYGSLLHCDSGCESSAQNSSFIREFFRRLFPEL